MRRSCECEGRVSVGWCQCEDRVNVRVVSV